MKKLVILFITIFSGIIHTMSFECLPTHVKLQIFKFVADNRQNLKYLVQSERVSKKWRHEMLNQEIQNFLTIKKDELMRSRGSSFNSCGCTYMCGGGAYLPCDKHR